MKIYEAMVRVDKEDCTMCAPGTTYSGTHANIVHMVAPAHTLEDAKAYFKTQGHLFSKVHEVAQSKFYE